MWYYIYILYSMKKRKMCPALLKAWRYQNGSQNSQSKKDREHNDQQNKHKQRSIKHYTYNYRSSKTSLINNQGEIGCSGRVNKLKSYQLMPICNWSIVYPKSDTTVSNTNVLTYNFNSMSTIITCVHSHNTSVVGCCWHVIEWWTLHIIWSFHNSLWFP